MFSNKHMDSMMLSLNQSPQVSKTHTLSYSIGVPKFASARTSRKSFKSRSSLIDPSIGVKNAFGSEYNQIISNQCL